MRFIDEVCNLFDVEVICDIETADPLNEAEVRYNPVVAIGARAEHGAGLFGYTMTPWFREMVDLNHFCERNIEKFREASVACDNGAAVPDATGWV
jgi:hypothetical protein